MSTQVENPQITRARSWQEWVAERSQIDQYVLSDAVVRANRRAFKAKLRREQAARNKEARIAAAEEADQLARAEQIRLENIEAGRQAADQACKACFCIHSGECFE